MQQSPAIYIPYIIKAFTCHIYGIYYIYYIPEIYMSYIWHMLTGSCKCWLIWHTLTFLPEKQCWGMLNSKQIVLITPWYKIWFKLHTGIWVQVITLSVWNQTVGQNVAQVFRAQLIAGVWQTQLVGQVVGDSLSQLEWEILQKGTVLQVGKLECLFMSLVGPWCHKKLLLQQHNIHGRSSVVTLQSRRTLYPCNMYFLVILVYSLYMNVI